jgi:hypothetical protein
MNSPAGAFNQQETLYIKIYDDRRTQHGQIGTVDMP